jgi:hypothetical protein
LPLDLVDLALAVVFARRQHDPGRLSAGRSPSSRVRSDSTPTPMTSRKKLTAIWRPWRVVVTRPQPRRQARWLEIPARLAASASASIVA